MDNNVSIAKNLLLNKICNNCRYVYNIECIVSRMKYPEMNTCDNWKKTVRFYKQ